MNHLVIKLNFTQKHKFLAGNIITFDSIWLKYWYDSFRRFALIGSIVSFFIYGNNCQLSSIIVGLRKLFFKNNSLSLLVTESEKEFVIVIVTFKLNSLLFLLFFKYAKKNQIKQKN